MSRTTEDSNRRMRRARDAMDRTYAQPLVLFQPVDERLLTRVTGS